MRHDECPQQATDYRAQRRPSNHLGDRRLIAKIPRPAVFLQMEQPECNLSTTTTSRIERALRRKRSLWRTKLAHDAQPQRCQRSGGEGRKVRRPALALLLGDRGPRFIRDLQTLIEDLLDVIGRPDDGIDHILVNGVRETMLYPGKSDHSLAAMGVVAQTACDVVANLNLHCGLAEVDVAAVAQFKAHHVLHDAVKPLAATEGKPIRGDS
jgi:hypothetical protein